MTVRWNPYSQPLLQRVVNARMADQARMWRDELRRVPTMDNPPISNFG